MGVQPGLVKGECQRNATCREKKKNREREAKKRGKEREFERG